MKQILAATLLLAVAACAPAPEAASPAVGMANPASVHCRSEGGKSEIRRNIGGDEYGVCVFEDGRQCEESALFRDKRCVVPKAASSPLYEDG